MNTFALKREYELQMPTNFFDVDMDEMEYVDGGYYYQEYWWGYAMDLSPTECGTVAGFLDYNLFASGGTGIAGLIGLIAKKIPYVNAGVLAASIVYGLGVAYAKTVLIGCASAQRSATLSKNLTGYHVNVW
jgi:hypothetical protein